MDNDDLQKATYLIPQKKTTKIKKQMNQKKPMKNPDETPTQTDNGDDANDEN